jgi:hypothetical protein
VILLYHALLVGDPPHDDTATKPTLERTMTYQQGFRLQANVRRGSGSSLPGAGSRYLTVDDAREAARQLLRDERVVQVTVVADTVPPRFVEWVNR